MLRINNLLFLLLLINTSAFGQVGIGTTAPQYPLDVNGRIRIQYRNSEGAGLWFNKPDNTLGSFIGQTTGGHFGIANTSTGNWPFVFDSQNARLGIGTDNPTSSLTIKRGGLGLEHVSTNGAVSLGTYVSNISAYIQTNTNTPLRFATNNADGQLTLGTNGYVGIGTLIPNYPLSFSNTVGDKISLWSTDPTSTTAAHYGLGIQGYQFQLFAPTIRDNIVFGIGNSADFTENVRFTGDGKVGIGTTNPASPLTIKVNSISSAIGLDHISLDGSVRVGTYAGNLGGYIQTHSNHPLLLTTNNNQFQAVLSPAGLFGIGTGLDPVLGGLVVNKKVGATNAVFGSNTTGVAIESNYPGVAFNSYYTNGRKAIAPGFGGGIGQEPTTGRIYLYSSSTSVSTANGDMPVTERLSILPNGNVGVGTINPQARLEIAGSVRLATGNQGEGKVLTSDNNGNARWEKAESGAVAIKIDAFGVGNDSPYDLRNNATPLLVGAEVVDDDNRYNAGSYIVGQAGYYLLNGSLLATLTRNQSISSSLDVKVQVYVNDNYTRASAEGSDVLTLYSNNPGFYLYRYPAVLNTVIKCSAGDIITFKLIGHGTGDLAKCTVGDAQFTITKL